jgi:hypothetical protein
MAAKEVVIPDFVPPKEMSVVEILSAAVARGGSQNIDLAGLLENVDVVEGRPLTDKASLIGTPHVITSVSFRKGAKDKDGLQHDYVSCEYTTVTAPPIEGVYNDGSTGIRRQIVAYLADKGIIHEDYKTDPDVSIWVLPDPGSEGEKDPEFGIKFLAPRGLRVSEYDSEFAPDGKASTYYLA